MSDITSATKLVCGHSHACVIDDGAVKCWGGNTYGQVGNGTKANAPTPERATF